MASLLTPLVASSPSWASCRAHPAHPATPAAPSAAPLLPPTASAFGRTSWCWAASHLLQEALHPSFPLSSSHPIAAQAFVLLCSSPVILLHFSIIWNYFACFLVFSSFPQLMPVPSTWPSLDGIQINTPHIKWIQLDDVYLSYSGTISLQEG